MSQTKGQQPLRNPFGIPDPNEKEQKNGFQKSYESAIQAENQDQNSDLNGFINMGNQFDEQIPFIDQQPLPVPDDSTDERTLLEELDITSPSLIKKRIISVLTFSQYDDDYLKDPDLTGAILILVIFALILVPIGKLHFSYLYLFGLSGWIMLYLLMNFMIQEKQKQIEFYKVLSYLGYGCAPILILSFTGIFINLKSSFGLILGLVCLFWSTASVSKTFDKILALEHRRLLIAYPLLLFYSAFVLITIF